MAKGGEEDNSATWPAEGLRIYNAFKELFPIAWASYYSARRDALGSGDYRRRMAYQDAHQELEVELRGLLESKRSERFELWGRLGSPRADAENIPASNLSAWTIDFYDGTADGQGVPLFDLRLRRK